MHPLIPWLCLAGALHLIIVAANAFLPRRLDTRNNLTRLTPILRQVFLVHWLYILLVLAGIAALCFFFPAELLTTTLGRAISAFLAVFWFTRAGIQLFYYDPAIKRQHPWLDAFFVLTVLFLGAIFTLSAMRFPQ